MAYTALCVLVYISTCHSVDKCFNARYNTMRFKKKEIKKKESEDLSYGSCTGRQFTPTHFCYC